MKSTRIKTCLALVGLLAGVFGLAPQPASASGAARTVTDCEGHSDSVARLYNAAFLRQPEQSGFDYWMATYTSGSMSLTEIAGFFSGSPELVALYGDLDDAAYVDRIYRNVLDRGPDAEGLEFWLGEMASGMDRGTVLLRFSESPENVAKTGTLEPTSGFFGNGFSEAWECDVNHADVESVVREFAEAVANKNTTRMSILSAEVSTLDAGLPEFELGSPALYLNPADPELPMCEPIGDFSQLCSWFLLEDASITWTIEVIVTPEGVDFDGSGWTGRYIVSSYELTRVG